MILFHQRLASRHYLRWPQQVAESISAIMTRSVEEFNKYQTNDEMLTIGSADIVASMRIEAALSEGEKRALINATVDLRRCLTEAGRSEFPTEARFLSRLSEIEPASAPRLVVTSLLPLMTEPEDP